ncbi:MAG: cytochrome c biogenesis protein CcdA [Candidatus Nanoarchaeia archaeon]|nr:cytochrome c biogenesis protein CcdA [Candidatus Nanoarchaeia archaeon]MDD5587539.1 cytochrome c biogenesis protein CcdA [Candidatus Nanoarchaeia archaeon]
MKKILLSIILFVLLLSPIIYAAEQVDVYFFYGRGCPHCAAMETFLEDTQKEYSNLNVKTFEIYFNEKDREYLQQLATAYGTKVEGVPTIFIGDKFFVGESQEVKDGIIEQIQKCSLEKCEIKQEQQTGIWDKLTIPAVISAAAVDSINPCEFAVLIILLTTILVAGNKKKALFAGLAFSAAIFISYLLMGFGLYSAIQYSGIIHIIYIVVSILAILVGLFNLKDYLWYGKWFIMEVPLSWRPRMKSLVKSVASVPGAFGIGILVSLFLLPCTSGPYIVILGLLAKAATRANAVPLLLLYNLIFVLPMLIITLAVYFGITTTEKAEEWRTRKLRTLHLITGSIILLLGIVMLASVIFGWL